MCRDLLIPAFLVTLILLTGCSEGNPISSGAPYIDSSLTWYQTAGMGNHSVFSLSYIPGKLYAGTDSGIFLSTNEGSSWTHVSPGIRDYVISLLSFSVDTGRTYVFAGTSSRGIYLSTDYGTSWTQRNTGLGSLFVSSIIVSPDQEYLFAGTWGGVFRSTDMGSTWSGVNVGLTVPNVESLSIYDSNLYAGTLSGIFRSTDYGATWSPLNFGHWADDVLSLSYIKGNTGPTYLFAGTLSIGIRLSTDDGTSWHPVDSSLTAWYVPDMTTRNSIIFSAGIGVFASTNLGASWLPLKRGLPFTDIRSVTTSETFLFAGAFAGGVWRRSL